MNLSLSSHYICMFKYIYIYTDNVSVLMTTIIVLVAITTTTITTDNNNNKKVNIMFRGISPYDGGGKTNSNSNDNGDRLVTMFLGVCDLMIYL